MGLLGVLGSRPFQNAVLLDLASGPLPDPLKRVILGVFGGTKRAFKGSFCVFGHFWPKMAFFDPILTPFWTFLLFLTLIPENIVTGFRVKKQLFFNTF